jgi:ribosomal protein L11 methylase PrmA
MSGITELVRDSVVDTYIENHGWVLDEEKSENGWHCVTLTRA